jgi:hypothetical protein
VRSQLQKQRTGAHHGGGATRNCWLLAVQNLLNASNPCSMVMQVHVPIYYVVQLDNPGNDDNSFTMVHATPAQSTRSSRMHCMCMLKIAVISPLIGVPAANPVPMCFCCCLLPCSAGATYSPGMRRIRTCFRCQSGLIADPALTADSLRIDRLAVCSKWHVLLLV